MTPVALWVGTGKKENNMLTFISRFPATPLCLTNRKKRIQMQNRASE